MKSANQKQSGFLPMLKNVFRRNILLLILIQLATFSITGLIAASILVRKPTSVEEITMTYSEVLAILFSIFYIGFSLITAYILFRELFSRRASDFLLSMPVKREAYFNANFLFGIINIALSYVISFAVSVFLIKSNTIYPSEFYVFDVSYFAKAFILSFLAAAAVFAIYVLCAAISGRKWHYFLLSYFAVTGIFGAVNGLSNYASSFIWGYWTDHDYSWIVSPISLSFISSADKTSYLVPILAAFAVQIAVVYAAGLIAFKRRKAEVAETTVSGKIVPFLIITSFLLSEALNAIGITHKLYINIIVAFILMALVVLVITALFYRKAVNKLTAICFAAAAAITAIVVCCVQFLPNATGYVDYVPESSEIESVTVKSGGDYEVIPNIRYLRLLYLYYDIDLYGDDNTYSFSITGDEAKSAVSELHKKIVSDEIIDKCLKYYDGDGDYEYDSVNGIRFEYKLTNGKTVIRTYSVNASSVCSDFAALIKTDECLKQIPPMNFDAEDILFLEADFFDYDDDGLAYTKTEGEEPVVDDIGFHYFILDEYKTLMNCIMEDARSYSDMDFFDKFYIGFSSYWYNDWDADIGEPENDEVFRIAFYKFSEYATDEEKEKMSKMTPQEMINYNNLRMKETDYEADDLLEMYQIIITRDDKNTIDFFEKQGYEYLESLS